MIKLKINSCSLLSEYYISSVNIFIDVFIEV